MKQLFNPVFTFFLLCFSALTAFADSPEIKLNWRGTATMPQPGKKPVPIPTFEGAMLDHRSGLPLYSLRLPGVEVATFQLKDPVFAPLTPQEAKNLATDKLKAAPEVNIAVGTTNGKILSTITFAPIRLNPTTGTPEKLVSFTYTYTTQNNQRKRRNHARTYTTNSVLSSGEWFKIGVTATGIYKLDRSTLQSMGVNLNNLDPRRIKIYGNAAGMLPQSNLAPRHDDLKENAIYVDGENDGSFGNDDYVLFYAQGPHTWKPNAAKTGFEHSFNVYSDTAYYFLHVGQTYGKRVVQTSVNGTPSKTITTYNERFFHETDRENLLWSGREWFGEEFNNYTTSRDFTFPLTYLVPNSELAVTASVIGVSPSPRKQAGGRFTIKFNNAIISNFETEGHGGYDYHDAGDTTTVKIIRNQNSFPANPNELKVTVQFNPLGISSSRGLLNYLEVNAKRELNLYGNQTLFRSFENVGPNKLSLFQIGNVANNAGNTFVWDVTNPVQPVQQPINFASGQASFLAQTDTVREFVIFNGGNFPAPGFFGRVQNQNLHSLNQDGKLDLVIVTHPSLFDQANRLANHRRQHDKLKVTVLNINQIYNEFSSGAQDPTAIRDLMKMIYDRKEKQGTKTADSLIYLLLMGDASYDYKSKFPTASQNRTLNNTNLVPVYESRESINALTTFSSEDYYGLLDDNEGDWFEPSGISELVDIGIGRIPAKNTTEADVMVNKIIHYSNPDHHGKWRNRITFVADDEDNNMHQASSENISTRTIKKYPNFNIRKVYLDMYKQLSVPNGKRSPDCAAEIDRAMEQGSLIMNYTGHGGETGWAHEQILTVNQINNWKNYNNPAFMLTATCEFGRYDDPKRSSAAELAMLNPAGGAVGLVTTTRPVISYSNEILNNSFFDAVLEPIQGRMPRLGDIYLHTKNTSIQGAYNRNFALLCDPSMRLAYPQEKVKVANVLVNNQPSDTLKALSNVTITGRVTNQQNQTLSNFNGKVQVTVFEKETIVRTLGDGGAANPQENIATRENIIYDGSVTATNGLFSSTFIVPKDINYTFGTGKVSLYASNNNIDAHGANTSIQVGGSAKNIPLDTIPPLIKLFMDNESFVFGGLTGTNSMLISHLSDSSGINTAGLGIGHEITATLDGNKENVQILNEYYTSDLDNFRSGKVRYMFKNLSKGPHELKVKAWDNHNNSSEKRIEFIVAGTEGLALDHVLNYPNPFSTNTTFHFDHNRAGDDLDIQIQIFTVSGKLVKTLSATSFGSKPHISEISWNGRDDFNDPLAKGVYIYKLNVRSVRDGSKVSKYEKMVILN